jgi:hypothetical protein
MVKHKLLISWILLLFLFPFVSILLISIVGEFHLIQFVLASETVLSAIFIPVAYIDYQVVKRKSKKEKREWTIEDEIKQIEMRIERLKYEKEHEFEQKEIELRQKILALKQKEEELKKIKGIDYKKREVKPARSIIDDTIDVSSILQIFKEYKSLKRILPQINRFSLTTISDIFLEKVDKFDWVEEDKVNFIQEMLSFTPEERMEILNDMLEKSNLL